MEFFRGKTLILKEFFRGEQRFHGIYKEKVPCEEFLQGYTHLLGKSSGVNAVLLNSSGVRRKAIPQPGVMRGGGGGGVDIKCNSPIKHSDLARA